MSDLEAMRALSPATKPLVRIASADRRARMVFRLRLEGDGFQVVECSTADEARQRIEEGGVSVTILDVALSGTTMSGADVISRVASTFPRMAVVVLGVKDEQQADGSAHAPEGCSAFRAPPRPTWSPASSRSC